VDAIVGITGFVGGNLARQHRFDATFHSRNVAELAAGDYDLLVCAGAPAEKWRANADPEGDRARLAPLLGAIERVRAREVVLVSTVDVYPAPVEVDEDSAIDRSGQHPYGRHRLELEELVRSRFPGALVVRLPALFGRGLKKNAVYDLLTGNQVDQIHADGSFQFYGLDRLWPDVKRMRALGLRLVNVATEPVTIAEIAREAFGLEFDNRPPRLPARYDFRSRHAAALGGAGGYLLSRREVLADLARFVAAWRKGDR
jgi:nucleoside-diphosphate-sugar epimerase